MQFQRIRVPATRRADIPITRPAPSSTVASPAMLNQARRVLGAGPTWGRPASAALVVAYAAVVQLVARANWVAPFALYVAALSSGAVVLGLAVRWSRGVDFNAWLEADPRHRRGSCQWLIWRGEYSGRPCLACLASMPRRERRRWLQAAASPAVTAGWLGEPAAASEKRTRLRDVGEVEAGWLAWRLLPVGLLTLAVHQWTSGDATDRQTALPLSLATVLTAVISLNRGRRGSARDQVGEPAAAGLALCESCERMPATVTVRFPDGVVFTVCATCLAAGVHQPTAQPGGSVGSSVGEVSR
jgi:hypothetical protein